MPEFFVEMRWRCSACQLENLGRHKTCQRCGKPKQGEAFYDSPEGAAPDPSQAVTAPELVLQAAAGADWHCRYCGSRQRRDSGECAQCGVRQDEGAKDAPPGGQRPSDFLRAAPTRARAPFPFSGPPPATTSPHRPLWLVVLASIVTVLLVSGYFLFRTRDIEATVVAVQWTHEIEVERYQITRGEGFAESKPGDAFDVMSLGERWHHDEKVQDGMQTETYTDSEPCGQECTTTSVSCTVQDNGFKRCSGGDRVCTTKTCSVTRTRQVPRYKNVPVHRTYYAWKAWRWQPHRSVVDRGTDDAPTWPGPERVGLGQGCTGGEKERENRKTKYVVAFQAGDEKHELHPATVEEFRRLPRGTRRRLRVGVLREPELLP